MWRLHKLVPARCGCGSALASMRLLAARQMARSAALLDPQLGVAGGDSEKLRQAFRARHEAAARGGDHNAAPEASVQLEETNRQTKETLAAVIDAAPVAIVSMDLEKRVMLWTSAAERLFGYSAAEAIGHPCRFIPRSRQVEFDRLFERLLAGEARCDTHVRCIRKDGSPVEISIAGSAIYDRNGGPRGIACALQDITDAKIWSA